jgi:hypothetical protein
MLVGIVLILMAWFVEMPLWLSILTTVSGGLKIIVSLINFGIKLTDD